MRRDKKPPYAVPLCGTVADLTKAEAMALYGLKASPVEPDVSLAARHAAEQRAFRLIELAIAYKHASPLSGMTLQVAAREVEAVLEALTSKPEHAAACALTGDPATCPCQAATWSASS